MKYRIIWVILICLLAIFSEYYFLIQPLTKIHPSRLHFTYISTNALAGITQQLIIQSSLHLTSDRLTTATLTTTITGNFLSIFRFFQRLLRLPYFFRLSQWRLVSLPTHQLQLTLIIEVYHDS